MNTMEKSSSSQLEWITISKGVAIFGIVIHHWFYGSPNKIIASVLLSGGFGVHVFFILSAFGLTLSLLKKSNHNWIEWYQRRAKKMLIPFYLALIITIVIIFFYGIISGNGVNQSFHLLGIDLKSISATIFLYRFAIHEYVFAINPAWWFLITLLELYCIFPLLILFMKKYSPKILVIVSFFITFFFQILYSIILKSDGLVFQKFFLSYLFEFCFGIYLAQYFFQNKENFKKELFGVKSFMAGILFQTIGLLLLYFGSIGRALNDSFIAIGYFFIFINLVHLISFFNLFKIVFSFIGKISMSIFLLHMSLIFLFPHAADFDKIIYFFFYLTTVIFISYFFQKVILKPMKISL
jgi:peptidoglycan/LPS O-acetylase OafA/YrhL